MFFGLQVDRGNLVQAVSDNLLNDLNLTTDGRRNSNQLSNDLAVLTLHRL
jgi:hypothetical protein